MLNIKEIALKVADSLRNRIDGISHRQSNQGLVSFAEALIKELQNQNEQIAWMCSDAALIQMGYSKFSNRCEGAWNIPVFTFPPNTEQIEQRVAEWQPIETAPKDGSVIVVGYGRQGNFPVKVVYWKELHKIWMHYGEWEPGLENNATHWMPLPKAPSGASS